MKKFLFVLSFCMLGVFFFSGCVDKITGVSPMRIEGLDKGDAIAAYALENAFSIMPMLFIVAIVPFVVGLIIVSMIIYFLWKKKKAEYDLMSRIVESGKDIPMDIFKRTPSKKKSMQTSLAIIGCGLGIMVFFAFLGDKYFPFIGLGAIPLLVGVGKLIGYYFDMKSPKQDSDI